VTYFYDVQIVTYVNLSLTVKLWVDIGTNYLDPRPVSETRHLCRTGLLSNHFEVAFCSQCISIWQLLHKVNVTWNNWFRKKYL